MKKFLSLIAAFTLSTLAASAADVWKMYTIQDRWNPDTQKTYTKDTPVVPGNTVTFVIEILNKGSAYNTTGVLPDTKGTSWGFVNTGTGFDAAYPTISVSVGGRRDEASIVGVYTAASAGYATALICEYVAKPGDLARPLKIWNNEFIPTPTIGGTVIGIKNADGSIDTPEWGDGWVEPVKTTSQGAKTEQSSSFNSAERTNRTLAGSNIYIEGARFATAAPETNSEAGTWLSVRANSTELFGGEAAIVVNGASVSDGASTLYIWSGNEDVVEIVGDSNVLKLTEVDPNAEVIYNPTDTLADKKIAKVYELVFSQGTCRFKLHAKDGTYDADNRKTAKIYVSTKPGMVLNNGTTIINDFIEATVDVIAPSKPSVWVRLDGAYERAVTIGSASQPKMTVSLSGRSFNKTVKVDLKVSYNGTEEPETDPEFIVLGTESVKETRNNILSYDFEPGETEKEIYYFIKGVPTGGSFLITPVCTEVDASDCHEAHMVVTPNPAITAVEAKGFQSGRAGKVTVTITDSERNFAHSDDYKVEWFLNTADGDAATVKSVTFLDGKFTLTGIEYKLPGTYTSRVAVTTPDGVTVSADVEVIVKELTVAKLVRADGTALKEAVGENGAEYKIVLEPNPGYEGDDLYAYIEATDEDSAKLIKTTDTALPYALEDRDGLDITSGATEPFMINFNDNGTPSIKVVLLTSASYNVSPESKFTDYGLSTAKLNVKNVPAVVGKFRVQPHGKSTWSSASAKSVVGKEYAYEATYTGTLKTDEEYKLQASITDVTADLNEDVNVIVEWRVLDADGNQTAIFYTKTKPTSGWVSCPEIPELTWEGKHFVEVRALDKDQIAALVVGNEAVEALNDDVNYTDGLFNETFGPGDTPLFEDFGTNVVATRLGLTVTNKPGMSVALDRLAYPSEDGTYLGWLEGAEEHEVTITLDQNVTGVKESKFDVEILPVDANKDPAPSASDFEIVGGSAFNKTTVTIAANKKTASFKLVTKDGNAAAKYKIKVSEQKRADNSTQFAESDGDCTFAIYNRTPQLSISGGFFTDDNHTLVSTNDVSVSAGQLCQINWSLVADSETNVNNDWDGVKVTWYNGETSKSDTATPDAKTGAGTYEITFKQPTPENVFRTLTVRWEDKDGARGSMTWKVKVIPAKILSLYPLGPSSGVSSESKIHTLFNGAADSGSQLLGARGRGNGSVEIQEQNDFAEPTDKGDGAKRWMLGGADTVTLVAKPSDEKLTIINAAGEKEEFDQYFYSWLVATGIEGSNIYEVTRSGAPLSDMASNGRDSSKPIRLPSTLSEDGAGYPETIFEAVFSREFYPSDNCGDINGDGIPDLFVKHYGLGVFNGSALSDDTADLIDLARYNDDEDYLPSPSASGYNTPGKTNAWTQAGTVFGAAEEIRGFHHGLNTYRWDRDTMAEGAQYLRPAGIVADRDMSDAELVAEQIAIDGGIEALHSITNAVHIQGAIADMVIAHGVTPVMTSLAEEYLKSYITEKGGSPDDDAEAELIASSVKSAVAGSIPGGLNTEIRETSDYTKFAATIFDSEYEYNGETTTIANTLKGAWELDKHNTAALDALVHSVSNQYRSALHQALVDARYAAATKNVETLSFEAVKAAIGDYEIAKLNAEYAAKLEAYKAAKELFDADPEVNPDPGEEPAAAASEEEIAAIREAAVLAVADKEAEIREKALDADHIALMDTLKVYYLVGGVEIESDAARSMSRTVWEVVNWTPERPTDPTLADTDNDGLPDGYEYWMWYRANIGWFAPYTYKDDSDNVHTVTNYYRLGMDTTNFQPVIPGKIVPANDFTKGSGDLCGYRFDVENPTKFTKISAAEIASHFDPLVPANPADRYALDIDNDGISDYEEFVIGSNPISCDTSGDTIIDGWKLNKGLDIFDDCRDRQKGQWNVDNDAFATSTASLYRTVVWGTERRRVDGELTDVPVKKVQIWVAQPDMEVAGFGANDWVGYVMKRSALVREVICEADDDVFSHINDILSFNGENGVVKPISHPDSGVFVSNLLCWNPSKGVSDNSLPIEVSVEFKDGAFVARDPMAETLVPFVDRNTATIWHNQVYKLYGFDPRTGWKDGILGLRWDTTKNPTCFYPEAGMAFNTSPFTTAHEYYSFWYKKYVEGLAGDSCSVICRNTTNPIDTLNSDGTLAAYGADTDMDGLPDGWEYYIGRDLNPLSALDPAKNQTDVGWDSDGLTVWQEFSGVDSMEAYRSVSTIQKFNHIAGGSKWFNKFFPTDPYGSDTDGDGISDGMEGAGWSDTFYAGRKEFPGTSFTFVYGNPIDNGSCCIRGGGMNPCTIDTDMDGIPDLWEVRHAGIVIGEDGSPLRAASGAYTAELKIADGWVKGNAHPNRPFIAGGMDATFASDTATITGSVDPYTGTVRDYDFDHDGLENFQEYLTQSIRHWRYDDAETPLMGHVINWLGDELPVDQTEFVAPNTILRGVLKNDLPVVAEGDGDLLFVKMDAFDSEAYEASVSNRFDELIYNDLNMYVKDWADESAKVIVRAQHYDYESLGYFAPPSKEFDLMNFYDDQINSPKYNGAGIKRAARYMRPPSTLVAYYTSREEGANGSLGAKRFQAFGFASTDPRRWDSDGDGMDDYYETFHGLNPLLGNVDMISSIYPDGAGVSAFANAWNNFGLGQGATFGFHVGAYNPILQPWTMGLPEVDVDGDGLRNNEEMIMGNLTSPNTYHTDPTPAWMTDSSSKRSYVSMYYGFPTEFTQAYSWHLMGDDEDIYQSLSQYNNGKYAFSFEENEGYDTDGDWKADGTELVKSADQPSDPLDFTDPARRQAMYFTGNPGSAMMTKNLARPWQYTFDMLRQFTIECWVNPESVENEQVVVERSSVYLPARDEDFVVHEAGCFRANFRIGLAAGGQVYALFDDSKCVPSGSEPGLSSERINGPVLKTGEWVHVAATYDGKVFRLFINGRQYEEHVCSLIPATGLYTVSQDPSSTAHDYPVSKYGIADGAFVIGASLTDGANSVSSISGTPMLTAELLAKNFAGYVDEVRVWDGARKASDIAADYKKAYTASDVAALHENVYSFWSTGATRNDNDSKSTLPAELLINLGFETLPSAKNPDDVSQAPMGFAAAVPYALPIGWWDSAELASTVYANHCVIPTAQNTIGHLAMGDGSMWDSMYWLETGSGYTPISKHDLSTTGVPNSMNPYSSRSHNEDAYLHYWRMERLASGTGDSSYAELAKRYRFDLRGSFYASTDFYPLGDAYAKTCDKMWDGNGVSTAWADIGLTRVDDVMIPAWWKDLRGVTDESSLIEYKVGDETWNISPTEAYMRDLALGYMPGDVIGHPTGTKSEADLNKNGIPDWWEDIYGVHNANEDFDNDGLSNYQEYLIERDLNLRADPRNAYSFSRDYIDYFHAYGEGDAQRYLGFVYTDHDFMEDDVEASVGSNRNVYDANLDADHNGWTNYEELRARLSGRSDNTLVEEKEELVVVTFDLPSVELQLFDATNTSSIVVTEYRSKIPFSVYVGSNEARSTEDHPAGDWVNFESDELAPGMAPSKDYCDAKRYTIKRIIPVYGYDGLPTPTIDLEISGLTADDIASAQSAEKGEEGDNTAASTKVTLTAYSESSAGIAPVSFKVDAGKSVLKAFGLKAGKTTFVATLGNKRGIVRGVEVGWDYVGEVKIELTDGVEYVGTPVAPTIIDCCEASNYFLYSAQPVMRWDDTANYTSFRLQIATNNTFSDIDDIVYDSGKRDIPAKTEAGRTFKPEIYVGNGLDDNTVYYWRVSEYTSSLVEDCWSATASFQTAVALKTLDTGFGKLKVTAHAYGPSVAEGSKVIVGVYKSAAFVDQPVALKKVDIANNMIIDFDGIEAGEYFVMAYQDVNGNGVRDDYETWGYLCGFGSGSSNHWTPTTVEITTNRLVPAEASFYLEDTDVNQNEKPDCTEDMSNWKNHNNAGDNADTLDSDGDGIPDAKETEMGLNPYDPSDAKLSTSASDVMAYAEVTAKIAVVGDKKYVIILDEDGTVLTFLRTAKVPGVEHLVAYGFEGFETLKDVTVDVHTGEILDESYRENTYVYEDTVILIHSGVLQYFGFNSSTARADMAASTHEGEDEEVGGDAELPTAPTFGAVNTVPFTYFWKYITQEVLGLTLPDGEKLIYPALDSQPNGIPDGWELYAGISDPFAYKYGYNPGSFDADMDGIPNAWELEHGMNPGSMFDGLFAMNDDDVMAYAEVEMTVVMVEDSSEIFATYGKPQIGDKFEGEYFRTFRYGASLFSTVSYGISEEVTDFAPYADAKIVDLAEVKVALIHNQVYQKFGFDPNTANAAVPEAERVNTKEFTPFDKYITCAFYAKPAYSLDLDPKVVDTDKDGIPDGWELYVGTKANTFDRDEDLDGDGLTNLEEYNKGDKPLDPTCGSTLGELTDDIVVKFGLKTEDDRLSDPDMDGLTNYQEYLATVAGYGDFDITKADSDDDGVLDYFEPVTFNGKDTYVGFAVSDHDMMLDSTEADYDPTYVTTAKYDPKGDLDKDGWSNYAEMTAGTDPTRLITKGIDGYTLTEHPVPHLPLELISEDEIKASDRIFITATQNGKTTAKWEIGKGEEREVGEADLFARQYKLYVGMNPGVKKTFRLSPGNLDPRRFHIKAIPTLWELTGKKKKDDGSNEYKYASRDIDSATWAEIGQDVMHNDDPHTGYIRFGNGTTNIGSINYVTGEVTIDFEYLYKASMVWQTDMSRAGREWNPGDGYQISSEYFFDQAYFVLEWDATPEFGGSKSIYRLNDANEGFLREGKADFTVFVDQNGNGEYDEGEPRGTQHGVEIGWDVVRGVKINLAKSTTDLSNAKLELVAPTDAADAVVTTGSPIFRFKSLSGYASYAYTIKKGDVIVEEGTKLINGSAAFEQSFRLTKPLSEAGEYTWSVMIGKTTATASFVLAEVADCTECGSIEVSTKYFGPKSGKTIIRVYDSADFTGTVIGEAIADDATSTVTIDRVPAGDHYIVAFIDDNGNGSRNAYESWGYVNYRGVNSLMTFVPMAVTVEAGKLAEATLFIEDTDLNNNGIADSLEDPSQFAMYDVVEDPADTDGDGIPDDWENEQGLDSEDPTDAASALPGDVMAYIEVPMYLVTTEKGAYLTDSKLIVGDDVNRIAGTTFYSVYKYGSLSNSPYGRGAEVAAEGTISKIEPVTVALVHHQVYETFGFNSKTANPTIPTSELVNSKPFTALDKYLASVYASANDFKLNLRAGEADCDLDGIPDGWELYVGLNPNDYEDRLSDKDEDGLAAIDEYNGGNVTDPNNDHTLDPGISDNFVMLYNLTKAGADDDGDGLSNYAEYLITEVFRFAKFNPKTADSDGNGTSDYFEKIGDFYYGEVFADHDQIDDQWEIAHATTPVNTSTIYANSSVYDPTRDEDNDGWSNYAEFKAGTDPRAESTIGLEGLDGNAPYTLAQYPIPLVKLEVVDLVKSTKVGALKIVAWNDDKDPDMTGIPDAIWTIGSGVESSVSGTAGSTSAQVLTFGNRYIGQIPASGVKTFHIGYGVIAPNTVQIDFKDPAVNTYDENCDGPSETTEIVTGAGCCDWFTAIKDNGYGQLIIGGKNGRSVGAIDYSTGLVSIDFSDRNFDTLLTGDEYNPSATGSTSIYVNPRNCHALISWGSTKLSNSVSGTYYLSDPDQVVDGNCRGRLREGKTTFMVFVDTEAGSSEGDDTFGDKIGFTVGEPMGIVRGVDVGWAGASLKVELTRTSPIFERIDILNSTSDRIAVLYPNAATAGSSSSTTKTESEDGDETTSAIGATSSKKIKDSLDKIGEEVTVQIYVKSYDTIDGVHTLNPLDLQFKHHVISETNPYRIIRSIRMNLPVRGFITEADVLNAGEYDVAWKTFKNLKQETGHNIAFLNLGLQLVLDSQETLDLGYDIVRYFDQSNQRITATNLSIEDGFAYGAHPTFKWEMPKTSDTGVALNTYPAFIIEVAELVNGKPVKLFDTGRQRLTVFNEGKYSWKADFSIGDQLVSVDEDDNKKGVVLKKNANYVWRVAMLNTKFNVAVKSTDFSPYATLATAVNSQQAMNDHNYGSIAVKVNYSGHKDVIKNVASTVGSELKGQVRVQAFTSPDFSGTPAAETVATKNDDGMISAKLIGLVMGDDFYVRAYIDQNGDHKKSAWESWGAAADKVKLTGNLVPEVSLNIEDCDTDQDWLPDAWEYVNAMGASNFLEKESATVIGDDKIALSAEILSKFASRLSGAAFSNGLPGASLTTFENASFAANLLGVKKEALIAGTLPYEIEEGSVAIVDFKLTEDAIKLTFGAEVLTMIDSSAKHLYDLAGTATATVKVLKKTKLTDTEWDEVATVTGVQIGTSGTEITVPFAESIDLAGFFTIEIIKE